MKIEKQLEKMRRASKKKGDQRFTERLIPPDEIEDLLRLASRATDVERRTRYYGRVIDDGKPIPGIPLDPTDETMRVWADQANAVEITKVITIMFTAEDYVDLNPDEPDVVASETRLTDRHYGLSDHVSALGHGRAICSCGFRADGHEAKEMLDQHLQDQLAPVTAAPPVIRHEATWATSTTSAVAVCTCGWSITRTWKYEQTAPVFKSAISIAVDEHSRTHDQPEGDST